MRSQRNSLVVLLILGPASAGAQIVNQVGRVSEDAPEIEAASAHPATGGAGAGIVVDGAGVETKADPPCWPSAGDDDQFDRFIDCGNGTIHDTATGLLWLKNANCFICSHALCDASDGQRDWFDANSYAAQLGAPQCGLSDHSQPGDWRLPSRDEWDTVFDAECAEPRLVGKADGCFADPGGAWADSVQSDLYWSRTTSFLAFGAYLRSLGPLISYQTELKTKDLIHAWPVRSGQ